MELLTTSRARSHDDCRRKGHLEYVEGIRPFYPEEALRVGTAIHQALEAWLEAHGRDDQLARTLDRLAAVTPVESDAFEVVRLEEMLRGYHMRWSHVPLNVVEIEREFRTPLVNPATLAKSRTFELGGKIDGIVRNEDGRLMILEHKTASNGEIDDPSTPYWTKLAMDSQVSMYYIGAESLGYQVEGCLYDVLRKPQQRPLKATPLESRKYTKPKIDKKTQEVLEPARLYKGQREFDETPEEYRARIRKHIEENLEAYFVRREVHRVDAQLREFLYDAWAKAAEMRAMRNAHEKHGIGAVPRNTSACHRYNRECPYWDLCSAGLNPDNHPDRFRRVGHVHPELTRAGETQSDGENSDFGF